MEEGDEALERDAELGEASSEVGLEVLSVEMGEELNTTLSAIQGWEVSLATGLTMTGVGSALRSTSFCSGDGETSTL